MHNSTQRSTFDSTFSSTNSASGSRPLCSHLLGSMSVIDLKRNSWNYAVHCELTQNLPEGDSPLVNLAFRCEREADRFAPCCLHE